MTIQDIDRVQANLAEAIQWLERYQSNATALKALKKNRRELRKIAYALQGNCAVAAYGESQVGKSYLISSLLASDQDALRVVDGSGHEYSFIDDLNPSGGSTAQEESTGVVTRFTSHPNPAGLEHLVKIQCLSIVDIILILCDAYYKDVKGNPDTTWSTPQLNQELELLIEQYSTLPKVQTYLIEDDIYDIQEYLHQVLGNKVGSVLHSTFFDPHKVATIIPSVPVDRWDSIFSLLWNRNEVITQLFRSLLEAYQKIQFSPEVYIPFDAVLRKKGTILKISWLDLICNPQGRVDEKFERTSAIYDPQGKVLCPDFDKAYLSALTAELSFVIPKHVIEQKTFLKTLDLLDLPGARRRENIMEVNLVNEISNLIRRGKVAYLFNKYSRTLRINSILFCQHQHQSGQSEMGEALDEWIKHNIGTTAEERGKFLTGNNGISPFFIVGTKFNIELKWTKETESDDLSDRWRTRFDKVLSDEIIKPQTYSWFNEWVQTDRGTMPFQSIYLLRDFFWSRDQSIYRGYEPGKSGEVEEVKPPHFPHYREELRKSFVNYPFVKKHFASPERSWQEVAALNRDGSEYILQDLSAISTTLDHARRTKYEGQLCEIKENIAHELQKYYIPNSEEDKRERLKTQVHTTRLELDTLLGENPDYLGRIVEAFMVSPLLLRRHIYDIYVRKTERPIAHSAISSLRAAVGIEEGDSPELALHKLTRKYGSKELIQNHLTAQGIDLDQVLSPSEEVATTIEDVLSNRIHSLWHEHITTASQKLPESITYRDSIGQVYLSLGQRTQLRTRLRQLIESYIKQYRTNEVILVNSIADAAAITLNNLVTDSKQYLLDEQDKARAQASSLGIVLETIQELSTAPTDILETLKAFELNKELVRTQTFGSAATELYRLPWWAQSHSWKLAIEYGLILNSDIGQCDHASNDALGELLNKLQQY